MDWDVRATDALVFKITNGEHGGSVGVGHARARRCVAWKRMAVTCASSQRVEEMVI